LKHVDGIFCQDIDASLAGTIPVAREGIFFGLVEVSGYIKPFWLEGRLGSPPDEQGRKTTSFLPNTSDLRFLNSARTVR
jgi:hypothetical protein